jgi:hypothetical protein
MGKSSRDRMRALRARRRYGELRVFCIEAGPSGVRLLVERGLLDREKAHDRRAVGMALEDALNEWVNINPPVRRRS